MGTVLLATDGSEDARQAADRAVTLAATRGVELRAIHVVDRRRFEEPALSTAELATIDAEDGATTLLREVTAVATERGVPAAAKLCHGIPHEEILDYADEVDAEAIVLGAHGDHAGHHPGVGRRLAAALGPAPEVELVVADTGLPWPRPRTATPLDALWEPWLAPVRARPRP